MWSPLYVSLSLIWEIIIFIMPTKTLINLILSHKSFHGLVDDFPFLIPMCFSA